MNAEQQVKAVYPNATIERQRTNGGQTYYLIRKKRGDFWPLADGKTRTEAWVKAAKGLPNPDIATF